ncbi:hypothetical protein PR202_gb06599 [Eleusine coracana subsp. coracana]|uniref:Protein kinase domain-containing protein n=1 Tax=Eleusine coracana subsp. coracana TaxID=191504 RepID=A0AAV5EA18_ELECO|nr:hypothetical protein PR202_gb06599 [Eleusine coracana subsp. coracana]
MTQTSLTTLGAPAPNIADQLALMSFKSRISSDPSQALATWGNLSLPICRWRGVACGLRGRRRGRVVALDLAELNILGTITPSLGNLTYLRRLDLSSNRFHDILPPQLGNLRDLKILYLHYNSINGQIPLSLSNSSHLVEISFYGSIPSNIRSLVNLKKLILQRNNMTGEIPKGIGNLVNLVHLGLGTNQFSGTVPSSLGNLSALTYLSIPQNGLEGTIPPLQSLSSLGVFELGANKLEGPIPSWLGNLTSLLIIDLQQNSLVGQIPESLLNLELLTHLDLSGNNLTGPIPHELGRLHALTELYLWEVGNLKNLAELDVSNNKISGGIPTSIGGCQSLEYFNTSRNLLQGTIPLSLGNLESLLVLDLSYNNFSGTIPEILGSLRGLSSLNLSFNKFEGGVPKDGVLSNATAILIAGNDGLCGGIPQLNLPPCSHHTIKKITQKITIAVSICCALLVVIFIFVLSTFYQKRWKKKANVESSIISEQYLRVSYAELASATNGFASENLIRAGSFGSVYKGRMRCNDQHDVIAVKVLNLMQRGASQSFVAECETLRCVRHRNLVKILTICSSIDFQGRDFKALVYEFLPNGNLDQWLHQHIMKDGERQALDLIARLRIAIDVASSLDYLHQYKPVLIVHCDLKPSNVLLDTDMVAHVGDFGLAISTSRHG